MDAGVDGREAAVAPVPLAYDGQAGLQVGQAAGGQGGAARGELQEGLALVPVHAANHLHKPLEARAVGSRENRSGLAN